MIKVVKETNFKTNPEVVSFKLKDNEAFHSWNSIAPGTIKFKINTKKLTQFGFLGISQFHV